MEAKIYPYITTLVGYLGKQDGPFNSGNCMTVTLDGMPEKYDDGTSQYRCANLKYEPLQAWKKIHGDVPVKYRLEGRFLFVEDERFEGWLVDKLCSSCCYDYESK